MPQDDDDLEVDRSERNRFGNVDARVIEDDVFTRNGRFVYTMLACRAGAGRAGIVKRKTMAKNMGVSKDTLDRAIQEMALAGIVEARERYGADGSRIANGYRLHDFLDLPDAVAKRAQLRAEEQAREREHVTPSRTHAQGGGRTDAQGVAAPMPPPPPHGCPGASRTHAAAITTEGLTTNQKTSSSGSGGRSRAAAPRATRLPEDWAPDPDLVARVHASCPDVDQEAEFPFFRRWWLSKSGKDATKIRWDLTYENWMAKEQKAVNAGKKDAAPRRSSPAAERLANGAALAARLRAERLAAQEPQPQLPDLAEGLF